MNAMHPAPLGHTIAPTTLRLALLQLGYRPVPITAPEAGNPSRGKAPQLKNWSAVCAKADEAEVRRWATGSLAGHTNTGLLLGELIGLDIDVPLPDLAERLDRIADAILGTTPLHRIGQAPKRLRCYRLPAPIRKIETPELFMPCGAKTQVEVLAEGQQFVGFGIHPVTGQPYTWPQAAPNTLPFAEVPVTSEAALRDFVAAAEAMMRQAGGRTAKEIEQAAAANNAVPVSRADREVARKPEKEQNPFFKAVNTKALENLDGWFPHIFSNAWKEDGTGAWRVSSADLNRPLEEDLSMHPVNGGKDFGTRESCSSINVVIDWAGAPDAKAAAFWLCEKMGVTPADMGWKGSKAKRARRADEISKAPTHSSGGVEQAAIGGQGQPAAGEDDGPDDGAAETDDVDGAGNDDGDGDGDGENDASKPVSLEIERLIRLPLAAYEAERETVANKHGIRVNVLDAERKKLEAKGRAAEKAKERAEAQKAKEAQAKAKQEQARQDKEAKEQAKLDAAWRATEARAKHRATSAPEIEGTIWPPGIEARADGLYYTSGDDDLPPMWLCDPIEILGQGRDVDGESWGLLLWWKDADQGIHTWPMPSRLLVAKFGDLEGELFDRGFRLDTNGQQRIHLRYALGGARCSSRVCFAETPGWNAPSGGASAFLLINGETVGSPVEQIVLKAPPEAASAKMRQAGTLEEWKAEVAAKAVGNTIAAFSICSAFAGPLLKLLGEVSGGFHFFGDSKAGKTLAMKLGVSVWGPTHEPCLLRSWRSTANGLESTAEECNDALLALDEVQQAEPKDVVSAVYLLANERGKQRLRQDASAKRARSWRTVILSNGEYSLDAMAAKAEQVLPAGAETRIPSVPIGAMPMWPNTHGAASPAAMISALQKTLLKQYGTAIRPFLTGLADLLAENDRSLEEALEELRQDFNDRLPENADAQVRDVSRRCALIALAGELATGWDILPWKNGEAKRAAKQVLTWWVERRGGTGSNEEHQHVKAVRSYLTEYAPSRLVVLELRKVAGQPGPGRWMEKYPERPVASRIGWRRTTENDDVGEFLITGDGWAKICTAASVDPLDVAKTLKEKGHLGEGEGKNLMRKVTLPGVGPTRCYVVLPSIFDGQDAETQGGGGQQVGTVPDTSDVPEPELPE